MRKKSEHAEVLEALKIKEIKDRSLEDEKQSCKHFFVDSEIEKVRVRAFNYALGTLNKKISEGKIDLVFGQLNCTAKANLAIGFILKNIEDGKFRYFHAHENNTLLNRSKIVCTGDDMVDLKEILNKTCN